MKKTLIAVAAFMAAFSASADRVGVWSGISTAGAPNWTVVGSPGQVRLFEREDVNGYPVVEYTGGDRDGFVRERGGATFRYWQGRLYAGNGTTAVICELVNGREVWAAGRRIGRFDVGSEGRFNGDRTFAWKGGTIPSPMLVYLAAVKYCGLRSGAAAGAVAAGKKAGRANDAKVKKPGPIFRVYAGEIAAGKVIGTYRDRRLWRGDSSSGDPEVNLDWDSFSFFAGAEKNGKALFTYSKGRLLLGDGSNVAAVLLSVAADGLTVTRHAPTGLVPLGRWDSRDFAVFRDVSGKVLMSIDPVQADGRRMDVPTKYYSLWKLVNP